MDEREPRDGMEHEDTGEMPVLPGGIAILVTQAFCPNGHNVVCRPEPSFAGHPGIALHVAAAGWDGEIVLSPFHGDSRLVGMNEEVPRGTRSRLSCPICGVPLPVQTRCGCRWGGELVALSLRRDRQEGEMIMLCDVYGCHNSRVLDSLQVLSDFADREDGR